MSNETPHPCPPREYLERVSLDTFMDSTSTPKTPAGRRAEANIPIGPADALNIGAIHSPHKLGDAKRYVNLSSFPSSTRTTSDMLTSATEAATDNEPTKPESDAEVLAGLVLPRASVGDLYLTVAGSSQVQSRPSSLSYGKMMS